MPFIPPFRSFLPFLSQFSLRLLYLFLSVHVFLTWSVCPPTLQFRIAISFLDIADTQLECVTWPVLMGTNISYGTVMAAIILI